MGRTKINYPQLQNEWWEEIGRTTLGVAGDTISVQNLPARKYLRIIGNVFGTGGTISLNFRFNNDTGSNYSARTSTNGAADTAVINQSSIEITGAATYPIASFFGELANIASVEKNIVGFRAGNFSGAGAGVAADRAELSGKWANTSAQISRIDLLNLSGTGDFAIGSELIILGHD